jgi:hypothetical protein
MTVFLLSVVAGTVAFGCVTGIGVGDEVGVGVEVEFEAPNAKRVPSSKPTYSMPSATDTEDQLSVLQKPRPTDIKGVDVTLKAIDPNGNAIEIAAITSNAMGQFKKLWIPEVPGEYTIQATFAGSESYWQSYAQTAIGVSQAPDVTPEPTSNPQSAADLYFVPAIAGLFVAIIVVGALVSTILLKKRPMNKQNKNKSSHFCSKIKCYFIIRIRQVYILLRKSN